MGVTIHFEGRLRSKTDLLLVREVASRWAAQWRCEAVELDSESKKLERVINEEDVDYEGPVFGVGLLPHPNSEPLLLEFDDDLYIQEYCKTQFAPPSTHVEVVALLRELSVLFEALDVFDEGGYWESQDLSVLEKRLEDFFEASDEAKLKEPGLSGPHRLSNGRIADLIQAPGFHDRN